MKRRAFIVGLGGVAVWPLLALAEQSGMPVIGFLSSRSPKRSRWLCLGFPAGHGGGWVY
jgi:hypothetical protein